MYGPICSVEQETIVEFDRNLAGYHGTIIRIYME